MRLQRRDVELVKRSEDMEFRLYGRWGGGADRGGDSVQIPGVNTVPNI